MATIHSPSQQALRKSLTYAATANGNSSSQDCRGYTRATVDAVYTTAAASGFTLQVQDSPDNSAWTNVAGATFTIGASAGPAHYPIDLNLSKRQRYVRGVISAVSGTVSVSVDIHLFNPQYAAIPAASWDNTPIAV